MVISVTFDHVSNNQEKKVSVHMDFLYSTKIIITGPVDIHVHYFLYESDMAHINTTKITLIWTYIEQQRQMPLRKIPQKFSIRSP